MNPNKSHMDKSEFITSPLHGSPARRHSGIEQSILSTPIKSGMYHIDNEKSQFGGDKSQFGGDKSQFGGDKSQFGTQSRARGELGYSQIPQPKAADEDEYAGIDEHGNIHQKEKLTVRKISAAKKMEESYFKPVEPPKKEEVNPHLKAHPEVEKAHGVSTSNSDYDVPVSYFGLFKYATTTEKYYVVFATLFSIASGVLGGQLPGVIGSSATALGTKQGNAIVNAAREIVWRCLYYGVSASFCGTVGKFLWSRVSSNLERSMRFKFFHSIMHKDCAWFDILSPERITT